MKKAIFSLIFWSVFSYVQAQSAKVDFSQKPPNIDSLLPKITAEKNVGTTKFNTLPPDNKISKILIMKNFNLCLKVE